MTMSIYIAKVMGPTMLVIGLMLLLKPAVYRDMAKEFLKSNALIFFAGFTALLIGLLVVAAHNVWVADWPVIITLFGWVAVAAGIARLTLADELKKFGKKMLKNPGVLAVAGAVYVALGAALTWFGWFAQQV